MKGHECVLTEEGEATCICQRQCNVIHSRLVCGSDGHIYPNHCELHRSACITQTAITIERGVHCIKSGKMCGLHRLPVLLLLLFYSYCPILFSSLMVFYFIPVNMYIKVYSNRTITRCYYFSLNQYISAMLTKVYKFLVCITGKGWSPTVQHTQSVAVVNTTSTQPSTTTVETIQQPVTKHKNLIYTTVSF